MDDLKTEKSEEKKPDSSRVKRMRGWLGVKSDFYSGCYAEESDAPVYGDGHSGWNR